MRRLARPLLYVGTVCAVLGFGKYHAAYVGGYSLHASGRLTWSLVYTVLLCGAAYALGLPDLRIGLRSALGTATLSTGVAAVGISLIQLGLASPLLPRFVVFASALVLVPWYGLCAALAADGRTRDEGRDRILAVVGPGEAAAMEEQLQEAPQRSASIVAVLDPILAAAREGRRPVVALARDRGANVVVLDRTAAADDTIVEQVAELHEQGDVRVRTLTLFYDEWLGKLPLSELERVSLMFDIGEIHRARYGRVKRMVDVVVGVAGVLALVLVLPAVWIGNRFGNGGTLLFRQQRIGKGGQPFEILKFRTMRAGTGLPDVEGEDPEERTGEWTTPDDIRVTPFGRWLRRTHLDELPQAWNILRGDLSLVGPRPEQSRYVHELAQKLPFYDLRHLVRPGLTGWAQVKYEYASSVDGALQKLQYEFWYLRHQGLVLDIRIVARTLRSVVGGGGR